MPEGIVPELIIAAALLVLVAGIGVTSRSKKDRDRRPPTKPASGAPQIEAPTESEHTITLDDAPVVTEVPTAETPVAEPEVLEPAPEVAPKRSLRDRLGKSRAFLGDKLSQVFGGEADEDTWDDLEAALIQADVGVETATRLTTAVREGAGRSSSKDPEAIRSLLADELAKVFDDERDRGLAFADVAPTVWMVVGVNGTGKTTTIGKLASDLSERGRSVALAAADTFRAAADEQLGVWAERSNAEVVKHQHGADPGAVAYDALQHARAKSLDVLIVDTAGRLHTKTPLMDELSKVKRVIEKEGKVHEVLLVIDATAGQNGLVQAKEFAAASGVTGVVLTKLDGTAKGGIAIAIENELGIPIKLIGVGEGIDDLEPFEPKAFVDALLT